MSFIKISKIFKLSFAAFFLGICVTFAQSTKENQLSLNSNQKVKSFSIGLKAGVPNIIGGGLEIVLPFFDHHFSIYGDLSKFNLELDDTSADLSYSEFGFNYYFNTKGKGLYLGAGFGKFDSTLVVSNIEMEGDRTGQGSVDLLINTTNLKLGLKTGGTFYFRVELGYGLGEVPSELMINASTSDGYKETVVEEVPNIPGISNSGILVGNIGFGLSF